MSCREMRRHQLRWAAANGIDVSPKGYTQHLEDNLLAPMNSATAAEFGLASGGELRPTRQGAPPKMHALHSSSALACNVFDYWRTRSLHGVTKALELTEEPARMTFEAQFPTKLSGEPPNVDLAIWLSSGSVAAIECKYTEPFCGRPRVPPFKDKYFRDGTPIWNVEGLPCAGTLAAEMQSGRHRFRYLNAAQLLKHALGLQIQTKGRFVLLYLYMSGGSEVESLHLEDIHYFQQALAEEFTFRAVSYETLLTRLRQTEGAGHSRYFEYLWSRYIAPPAA